jgi:hypothetical protein
MPWPEVFIVFLVTHLTGDFVLQTEWQAANKAGGLGPSVTARRALLAHVTTYTLGYVPALIWLWDSLGAGALGVAVLIAGPHLIQDDGRLRDAYIRGVKHMRPEEHPGIAIAVDQVLHILALFGVALVAGT